MYKLPLELPKSFCLKDFGEEILVKSQNWGQAYPGAWSPLQKEKILAIEEENWIKFAI